MVAKDNIYNFAKNFEFGECRGLGKKRNKKGG